MLSRDQAKALVDRIVKLSQADEIQVNINDGDERNIRFADNRITTAGSTNDLAVRISSAFGKRAARRLSGPADDLDPPAHRITPLSQNTL